ncbi:MAG TPA: TIGR00730 family Rossman fold protein [Chitinophagaceae bacterium]|nr:TIGR00730 family Rossman fold protein [Chitinophagaceae bacterium]HMZ45363.1 TIGR00730 family Rossman fold protein [Chitinophagaceae bacterium]HNF30198.1 TIGR00730 family Rossman fold protein [Chitinophagaceae bacterium]HNJ57473.1 TIGR00730 family Rossman fold protein [Chitinophagaceae bacterium]HNL82809.1 TIGR00730 family Rossman fold protein [Chitinophagaceae bacterium]
MNWKKVAVFCGSKLGNNQLYYQHAVELGKLLAEHKIQMVYGGGKVGIMGAIADAVMEYNGTVTGIIPELLVEWEQQHENISQLHVVKDMHIRKKMMYELCDAVIVLPGGYGTMDELFEVITWNNLKIHEKKTILLNTAGYYNHLIAHIDTMAKEGFLYNNWNENIIVANNPAAIFSSF